MEQTRNVVLLALLVSGCAISPANDDGPKSELDRLRIRSNAYPAFHLLAEITSGGQSIELEMAWRAPDRALLRYGENTRVLFENGVVRVFSGTSRYEMDYAGELEALEKRYGLEVPGGRPEPVFILENWEAMLKGRAPRATVAWRKLGARLDWLLDLERFTGEGRVYTWGAIRVELREDGFIERARIGVSGRYTLKQFAFDPPPDSLFEAPAAGDFVDAGPRVRPHQSKALEDEFHRWILAADPDDADLRALVKADFALRYEPEKLTDVLRSNVTRTIDAYRSGGKNVDPAFLRTKLDAERGRTRASLEIMAQEVRSDFDRALDRYFRGMSEKPSAEAMNEMEDRWMVTVGREFEAQIMRPFDAVFEDALKKK